MPADGEASRRRVSGFSRSHRTDIDMNVRCIAQRSTRKDREYGEASAAVIGHKDELPQWVDAQVSGSTALRADNVQECQISGCAIDAERGDRAGRRAVEIGNLIHGV